MKICINKLFKLCFSICFVLIFSIKINAESPSVTSNTKVLAHFDDSTTLALDYGASTTISTYGDPQIIDDGKHGKCLRLDSNDYISFNGPNNFGNFTEGTIMFWVRPHWNNDNGVSHTFCSMKLYNDGNDGYMAISDGWWESGGGTDILYGLANNQFGLSASKPDADVPLKSGEWYHITMTFKFNGTSNSFVKMYINGRLISSDVTTGYNTPGTCSARGNFQIGSSYGILDSNLRYADADFDEFVILDKALSDNEIITEYNIQDRKEIVAHFDDSTIQLDEASSDTSITLHGDPTIISDGVIGSCLSLDSDDYVSFDMKDNIGDFSEGTIMFWFRPHWTNDNGVSHTLCSMKLYNDGTDGYMTITDGWWESSGGTDIFYFLSNNQFGLNYSATDVNVPFSSNQWYHIAMTFRYDGIGNSFCNIYIDGDLVSSDTVSSYNTPGICSARDAFQLGSSSGILDANMRYADADFDEFYFSSQLMLSEEIKNIYDIQSGGNLKISADFSRSVKVDTAVDPDDLTKVGTPSIVYSDILRGKALSLDSTDYLKINSIDNIGNFSEGTVMFWVRPHWDNNNGISHNLCSMLLYNDETDGYLSMTDGWWEPAGADCFYFIANNQFGLSTYASDTTIPFEENSWYHVAMTFKFDGVSNSYSKMYINGELIATDTYGSNIPGECSPRGEFQLGSSYSIYDSNLRYIDSDVSNLRILTKALSGTVISNTWKLGSPYRLPYRDIYTIANDPYNPPTNASSVIRESRILLDEEGTYSTKAEAEALVDKAKDAGFNIIMTCVYHGNGARWDTTTIPVQATAYQTLIDGKEPLKYLIDYAHSQGIDVHAWFTINKCEPKMSSLFVDNGWVDSSFMEANGLYKVIIHYPGFRDFISDLVAEVVEDYGVDGVNLDFIRARGYCTTSYCQTDYSTKNPGRSLTTDISNKEYGYLGEWNYNAVTDIVSQINTKCAAIDSDVVISICGRLVLDDNRLTDTYASQGRDGKRWTNAGYIDFVLNMDYRMRPDYINFRDALTEFTNGSDGKAGFITTDYYYPDGTIASLDPDYTATLLSFSQRMKTGVVACYIYSMLSNDQITAIKAGPFKDTAVPYYD